MVKIFDRKRREWVAQTFLGRPTHYTKDPRDARVFYPTEGNEIVAHFPDLETRPAQMLIHR